MKWADVNPDYGNIKVKNKTKGTNISSGTKTSNRYAAKKLKLPSTAKLRSRVKKEFATRDKRNVWMSEQSAKGTKRWEAVREGVVTRDAQNTVWEDIPKGELGDRDKKGKLIGRTRQQGGAKGFISGQRRVSVGKGGTFWRGVYSGEKITDSRDIEVDHIVPILRAAASTQFTDNFKKLKQKQEFVYNARNLVSATVKANQAKGGYGLAKWQPPLESARPVFADAYHKVFKEYGMKMTVGEASKYTELTGKAPTVGLWNQDESAKINEWMAKERMKSRPKN